MRKQFSIYIITTLSLYLICACNNNIEKAKLTHVKSYELNLDKNDIDLNLNMFIKMDNVDSSMSFYYFSKQSNDIIAYNIYNNQSSKLFQVDSDSNEFISFNIINDTIFLIRSDKKLFVTHANYNKLYNLPIDLLHFPKFLSKIDKIGNNLYLEVGKENYNYIDTFSDIEFSFSSDTIKINNFSGAFPISYLDKYEYFKSNIRIYNENHIYYSFELSDSMFIYNLDDSKMPSKKIGLFTDFNENGFIQYDTTQITNMSYLKKYINTTERNVFTYQEKNGNNIYVVKQLAKEQTTKNNKFILGIVKDNQYLGYVYLPDDFNPTLHTITNNNLYYISTTENKWHKYSINIL